MSNEMNRHKDGKLWIHVELIPSWYDRIINDDLDNYPDHWIKFQNDFTHIAFHKINMLSQI